MSAHADFLHFFRQSESDLRAFLGSVIRDAHAREDVFQELSRTLWQKFDEFDLSRPFGAWARGIAGRKVLEARRRDAKFPLLFAPETVEAILEAFAENEDPAQSREAALRLCLDALPERPRGILRRRYEENWPCERIGGELGMKVKAVHQVLSRLRRALHRCITARLEADDFSPRPSSGQAAESWDFSETSASTTASTSSATSAAAFSASSFSTPAAAVSTPARRHE